MYPVLTPDPNLAVMCYSTQVNLLISTHVQTLTCLYNLLSCLAFFYYYQFLTLCVTGRNRTISKQTGQIVHMH